MVEIDMSKEPESGLLIGTNLWEVRDCKLDKSREKGDPMLRIKLKCGEHEMNDTVMLAGGGWKFGRKKLIALGLAANFSGNLDPLDFLNRRVWVATVEQKYEYIDKKDGRKKTGSRMAVDVDQLEHAGYQAESNPPQGAIVPSAGVAADDEAPF